MERAEYALMDAVEAEMWWYRALHRRLLDRLAPVRGRLLDAGCGTGGFLADLAVRRPDLETIGIDFQPHAAARTKAKSGAPAASASVERLPFPAGAFDAVLSADVLCHKSLTPSVALKEFARVLKPGGRLFLNLPAFQWLKSAHDIRVHTAHRSTAPELAAQLRACGFEPAEVGYWNSLLLPAMIVERKLIARRPTARSDVHLFPRPIDALLFAVTELERLIPLSFPAGGSVIAVARRT